MGNELVAVGASFKEGLSGKTEGKINNGEAKQRRGNSGTETAGRQYSGSLSSHALSSQRPHRKCLHGR